MSGWVATTVRLAARATSECLGDPLNGHLVAYFLDRTVIGFDPTDDDIAYRSSVEASRHLVISICEAAAHGRVPEAGPGYRDRCFRFGLKGAVIAIAEESEPGAVYAWADGTKGGRWLSEEWPS